MAKEAPAPCPLNGNGGRLLLALAWPMVTLLAIVAFISVALVAVALITAPTESVRDLAQLLTRGQVISRMMVLLVVVPSIAGLTVTNHISGEAAIAALSAIAGYVLGTQLGQP